MVGAVAFVIDVGGYNLLVYGPHLQWIFDLHDKPIPGFWVDRVEGGIVLPRQ